MSVKRVKTLSKADLILALAIVIVAGVIAAGRTFGRAGHTATPSGREVLIEVDNKPFQTVPFAQVKGTTTVNVPAPGGHVVVVEITEDGRARVRTSDCPDKVCVKTGWIEHPGEVIVCLPNRVVVEIRGSADASGPALDGIAY